MFNRYNRLGDRALDLTFRRRGVKTSEEACAVLPVKEGSDINVDGPCRTETDASHKLDELQSIPHTWHVERYSS